MKNIILWLLLSCLGISEPYVVEDAPEPFSDEYVIEEDAPNPYADKWIVEDAPEPLIIIEDADDPFAQEGMME